MTGRRDFALFLALGMSVPGIAFGQSETEARLLGNVGLGRPTAAVDSRSRAMGGIAVTLHGPNQSMLNPASVLSIPVSGVWVTFSSEARDVTGPLANGEITSTEFPLIRMAYPLGERWVVAAGFGSYLNQEWAVEFIDTLRLSTGNVPFQEVRSSDGGVSQFRLEFARQMSGKLALGVGGIFYFGESRLEVERSFETSFGFTSYRSRDAIEYQGLGLSLGGEWRPFPEMSVGAAGSVGTRLEAEADSSGASKDYAQPLALDLGASWRLAPDLIVALAAGWTDWSTVSADLERSRASDAWRFAVGSEARLLGDRGTQIHGRLGGRLEQLPFRLRGGAPWERALTLGVGARFRQGLGRMDLALEFGKRGDRETNRVEESYTRWTFSVSVFSR